MRRPAPVVLALALLVSGAAGAAPGEAVFAFAQTSLATTCPLLAKGVAVGIENTTAAPQPLHLGFSPATGARLAAACGGLSFLAPPIQLAPGDTVTVEVRAANATDVAGSQSGAVVAYAASGLATLLPVTIVPTSPLAAPTPLVSSVAATKYEHRGATPIWIPVQLGAATGAAFKPGDVVGAVASSTGRAPVTYVGTRKLGSVSAVGLDVSGLRAGTYVGTVSLAPASPTKGAVAITLVVKQWWVIVVALMLLSILVAFLVQRLTGVLLPRRKLRVEAESVSHAYELKRDALRAEKDDSPWRQSELTDVHDRVAALKTEIATKTASAYVSLSSTVVAAIESEISALADAVDLTKLAGPAKALEAALAAYQTPKAGELPVLVDVTLDDPVLLTAARSRLGKLELPVAHFSDTVASLKAAADDVRKLDRHRRHATLLYHDVLSLQELSAGDTKRLHAVGAQLDALTGAWRQIVTTAQSARLDDLQKSLYAVDDGLSILWPQKPPTRLTDELTALGLTRGLGELDLSSITIETTVIEPDPLQRDVADARRDAVVAAWLEGFALLVGLILAVVAGMAALYIGKPFGSDWDYVALITWGLATPPALTIAGTALDNLGALTTLRRGLT